MAVEIDGQRPVSSWIELIKDTSSAFHNGLNQIYSNNDDMKTFGELMSISHDGDRVTKLVDGKRVSTDNSCPAARLDALISDLESGVPQRVSRASLWCQSGGYNVSLPEIDMLVDIAMATPGVVGAGLVGAGMGGLYRGRRRR